MAFTEYMAAKMRKESGSTPVEIKGPLTLTLDTLQMNLDRIYAFCQKSSAACEDETSNYAKAVFEAFRQMNAPVDKDAVRIVIRTDDYAKQVEAATKKSPSASPPLFRPFAPGLIALLVVDSPRTVRSMNQKDTEKMGLSIDQVFEVAARNVRNTLKPLSQAAEPAGPGKIGLLTGNYYEVGRLALHDDWKNLATAQHGVLLVALPASDTVLYISESTPEAIAALKAAARRVAQQSPAPLSPIVLRWTESQWEVQP